jgi:hypothetical protein
VTKVLYIEHDEDNLYMLKMRLERVVRPKTVVRWHRNGLRRLLPLEVLSAWGRPRLAKGAARPERPDPNE